MLVSVFAGIRDYDVGGPDVLIYGNKVFAAMSSTQDLSDITNYATDRGASGEIAYYLLNWVVARFTDDPHVYYAVLAALCSATILTAVLLLRGYGPPAVMWATYMFTAYVEGFNLLRQSPALALSVLGVALVIRSRYRLGFFVGASGLLFHNSAVVFFIMWGVAFYLKTRREAVGRAVWTVLILSVVALVGVAPIMDVLSSSLGDTKYLEYVGEGARGGRAFGIDALYRAVPIALGVWAVVATRHLPANAEAESAHPPFTQQHGTLLVREPSTRPATVETAARRAVIVVLVLLSLELILLPVREISYPFYRLLAYFGYLRIIGYAMIVGALPKYRAVAGIAAIAFAAAYFFFIVIGRNEAFYSSAILDQWIKAD